MSVVCHAGRQTEALKVPGFEVPAAATEIVVTTDASSTFFVLPGMFAVVCAASLSLAYCSVPLLLLYVYSEICKRHQRKVAHIPTNIHLSNLLCSDQATEFESL